MDDADSLLLLALARLGCFVPENVNSMTDVVHENALPEMCREVLRVFEAEELEDDAPSSSMDTHHTDFIARVHLTTNLVAKFNAMATEKGLLDFNQFQYTDFLTPTVESARDACSFMLQVMWDDKAGGNISAQEDAGDAPDSQTHLAKATASSITSKVFEFIKANEKQRKETNKITKKSQNVSSANDVARSTLKRSYVLVDTPLYRDALQGDAMSKETFKHLVVIHESFNKLAENAETIVKNDFEAEKVTRSIIETRKKHEAWRLRNEKLEEHLRSVEKEIESMCIHF